MVTRLRKVIDQDQLGHRLGRGVFHLQGVVKFTLPALQRDVVGIVRTARSILRMCRLCHPFAGTGHVAIGSGDLSAVAHSGQRAFREGCIQSCHVALVGTAIPGLERGGNKGCVDKLSVFYHAVRSCGRDSQHTLAACRNRHLLGEVDRQYQVPGLIPPDCKLDVYRIATIRVARFPTDRHTDPGSANGRVYCPNITVSGLIRHAKHIVTITGSD